MHCALNCTISYPYRMGNLLKRKAPSYNLGRKWDGGSNKVYRAHAVPILLPLQSRSGAQAQAEAGTLSFGVCELGRGEQRRVVVFIFRQRLERLRLQAQRLLSLVSGEQVTILSLLSAVLLALRRMHISSFAPWAACMQRPYLHLSF